MTLKLYNTAKRQIVDFEPIQSDKVGMYCCGPTVYNYAHIGNLRTYLFEDVLVRAFKYLGYEVNHVMNVTDVGHLTGDGDDGEDKMIKGARERGMTVWDIAKFFTDAFFKDTDRLNIIRPTTVCRATEHIQDMINLIKRLEAKGLTYQAGGNVYFDTSLFPNYGKLAQLEKQELQPGARISVDEFKKNPRDFVLWFTQSKFANQAMIWDSPWGIGYPGWHIECSAMSMKYLGENFDIHCGGIDHIPVHHTNEIAQSEGATGQQWVNYWLHAEFLLLSKEKMSKSSGEFLTLQVLIDKGYDPLDYRFFCLSGHYRMPLTFTYEALDGAKNARRNLFEKVKEWLGQVKESELLSELGKEYEKRWQEALVNDLAMPQALSILWTVVKDAKLSSAEKLALVYQFDKVLGLGLSALKPVESIEISTELQELLQLRKEARSKKDWKKSDEIRDKLKADGWIVEDGPEGQKLKKITGAL